MRNYGGRTIFSASDLVNFMGCGHATVLDVRNLVSPTTFAADDENAVLLQEKGIQHERAYLTHSPHGSLPESRCWSCLLNTGVPDLVPSCAIARRPDDVTVCTFVVGIATRPDQQLR